jgi:ribA/ribD-fused uncharacterized protein
MSIDKFTGQYGFLSNFHPCPKGVEYEGFVYPTTEHAFQAAKSLNVVERDDIRRAATPGISKRMGRQVSLRANWEGVKDEVMAIVLRSKFTRDSALRDKLLATGDTKLVEGNNWDDTYWGVCRGKGKNRLGKLLMRLRTELRDEA